MIPVDIVYVLVADRSLFLIARNCDKANLGQCGMLGGASKRSRSSSVGSKLFAVSVSDDGGESWGPISHQPQLITPVCQASIISYKGPNDAAPALYFSGPHSNHTRRNGTILASDDNGVTFSRSLNIFPYANGTFGYSSVACGMKGENDCGVLFDNGDRLIGPYRSTVDPQSSDLDGGTDLVLGFPNSHRMFVASFEFKVSLP